MSSAHQLARSILNGFEAMFADFQNVTLGAKARFEQGNWLLVQQAQAERLEIYQSKIVQLVPLLNTLAHDSLEDLPLWTEVKGHYIDLIRHHGNYEIAETFFNSVFCKVFRHRHIANQYAFVTSSQLRAPATSDNHLYNTYYVTTDIPGLASNVLLDYPFGRPFANLTRDVRNISRKVRRDLLLRYRQTRKLPNADQEVRVDVMEPVFYRNKAAYMVGRIIGLKTQPMPFALPILHNEQDELYVDTLITDPDEVSIIFSFTRSYFMVDSPTPGQIVDFLHSLMPHKKKHELYASIGFRKHAKTEFYRHFVEHLRHSDDEFIVAPGIKGMVMSVFTLPSYNIVFKIIKDRFQPPKEVTAAEVKAKYRLVTHHDRVGRMADTQEFKGFRLPRARFSPELLDELLDVAPSSVTLTDTEVIIKHLYTERRMVPLNLYLRDASEQQIEEAMDEYGNAIKQLAAANIFPGDMLLKNFGVTRHGRVVFYDYDEICHITECNFRTIPEPKTEEQAMAAQPWYSVAANDIFPEEFRLFFSGNPKARRAFDKVHSELYQAQYWQQLKEQIETGKVVDVFPYRRKTRFRRSGVAMDIGDESHSDIDSDANNM
jgi:isocitrate dehydrogenase kinase/phosphatase